MFLFYRNQSIDLQIKTIDWFLYEENFGHLWINVAGFFWSVIFPEIYHKLQSWKY